MLMMQVTLQRQFHLYIPFLGIFVSNFRHFALTVYKAAAVMLKGIVKPEIGMNRTISNLHTIADVFMLF